MDRQNVKNSPAAANADTPTAAAATFSSANSSLPPSLPPSLPSHHHGVGLSQKETPESAFNVPKG